VKPSRYARVLRLQRLRPGPLTCFGLLEGSLVLGGLLALSELVPWWFGAGLPFLVAAVVKGVDALPRLSAALPGVATALAEAVATWSGASGTHAGRRRAAGTAAPSGHDARPATPTLAFAGRRATGRPLARQSTDGSEGQRAMDGSVALRATDSSVARRAMDGSVMLPRGAYRAVLGEKGADWPVAGRPVGGTASSNRALVTASSARAGRAGRVARGVAIVPEDSRASYAGPAGRRAEPSAGRTRAVGAWPMPADPTAPTQRAHEDDLRERTPVVDGRRGMPEQSKLARARHNRGRFGRTR
jgi:hypothetical protein